MKTTTWQQDAAKVLNALAAHERTPCPGCGNDQCPGCFGPQEEEERPRGWAGKLANMENNPE